MRRRFVEPASNTIPHLYDAEPLSLEEEQTLTLELANAAREWRDLLLSHPVAQEQALKVLRAVQSGKSSPKRVIRDMPSQRREAVLATFDHEFPAITALVEKNMHSCDGVGVAMTDEELDASLQDAAILLEQFPLKISVLKGIHRTLAALITTQPVYLPELAESGNRFQAHFGRADAAYERWMGLRNHLVERNTRLVSHLAKKAAARFGARFDEAYAERISCGMTGLIHAAETFDPDAGFRFAAHADRWIRCRFRIDKQGCPLPALDAGVSRVRGAIRELAAGQRVGLDEIAQRTGLSPVTVKSVLPFSRIASLDDSWGEEGDKRPRSAHIAANVPDPADGAEQTILQETLDRALRILQPRERQIIEMIFGLPNGDRYTATECAKVFHYSDTHISSIRDTALRKLRRFLEQRRGSQGIDE